MQGNDTFIQINYPYYQYLLSDYIARFDGQDHLYENEKVWYLLFQLCETASIFHSAGLKVGDVRPINVFLDNSERVKIGNRLSWPHATTNYEKSIFDKEVTYLGILFLIQPLRNSKNSASATMNPTLISSWLNPFRSG